MTAGTYTIERREEHCHRCKRLALCIVRINAIRYGHTTKTALCDGCALKEQADS